MIIILTWHCLINFQMNRPDEIMSFVLIPMLMPLGGLNSVGLVMSVVLEALAGLNPVGMVLSVVLVHVCPYEGSK